MVSEKIGEKQIKEDWRENEKEEEDESWQLSLCWVKMYSLTFNWKVIIRPFSMSFMGTTTTTRIFQAHHTSCRNFHFTPIDLFLNAVAALVFLKLCVDQKVLMMIFFSFNDFFNFNYNSTEIISKFLKWFNTLLSVI